jgi:hypothetical protein
MKMKMRRRRRRKKKKILLLPTMVTGEIDIRKEKMLITHHCSLTS